MNISKKPVLSKILFPTITFVIFISFTLACKAKGSDSPQWGEKHSRNMISNETGLPESLEKEQAACQLNRTSEGSSCGVFCRAPVAGQRMCELSLAGVWKFALS